MRRAMAAAAALVGLLSSVGAPVMGGSATAPASAPAKGDAFPPFEAVGVDGTPRKIDFPKGTTTVLLFFMSSCPGCHRMIPEWNRAYERRARSVRVVGVLMDQEPPGLLETMAIAFPVVRSPGRDFLRKLKITRAPTALRLATGGMVEDVALGPVDGMRVGEIFRP